MCTQTQEVHYTTFCFKDNEKKKQLLWENIVDLNTKYTFEVETNFPVANKTLSALYSKAKEKDDSYVFDVPILCYKALAYFRCRQDKTSRRFRSSQYLADSSLSQDVSNGSFFGQSGLQPSDDVMDVEQPAAQPEFSQTKEPEKQAEPEKYERLLLCIASTINQSINQSINRSINQ